MWAVTASLDQSLSGARACLHVVTWSRSVPASVVAPGLIRSARASRAIDRTVHMVVPVAAGGPTDVNARVVAEQLAKIWSQQVVIDNKGGAGTNIGNAFVAHSVLMVTHCCLVARPLRS